MNYQECYEYGRRKLTESGVEEAQLDARLLLEYICGTERNDLLVHGDRPVIREEESRYLNLIGRRARRIPLQHLTGEQEFMGLKFRVSDKVLIPRQDTEILVEEVMRGMMDASSILDMCTGSGCILLSLLHYSNGCTGVGVDLSEEALKVACENAASLGIQADFLCSDLFDQVTGRFDILVSNPPYIRSESIPELMPEVREHEPMMALDGSNDGLYFYRRLVDEGRAYLVNGGRMYVEIGYDQGEQVSGLMRAAGFSHVEVIKDYAGLDRVVSGTFTHG